MPRLIRYGIDPPVCDEDIPGYMLRKKLLEKGVTGFFGDARTRPPPRDVYTGWYVVPPNYMLRNRPRPVFLDIYETIDEHELPAWHKPALSARKSTPLPLWESFRPPLPSTPLPPPLCVKIHLPFVGRFTSHPIVP